MKTVRGRSILLLLLLIFPAVQIEPSQKIQSLIDAVHRGDARAVQRKAKKYPELLVRADKSGFTPLHWAVYYKRTKIIDFLLNKNVPVDVVSKGYGQTPLHLAARRGYCEIMLKLLSAGAKPEVRDRRGRMALHHAAMGGYEDSLALLLANTALIDERNYACMTPLHIAAYYGREEAVACLIEFGAIVDMKDCSGQIPLHLATWEGNELIVEMLISHGSEVSCVDHDGETPLHIVARTGHQRVAVILLENRADRNIRNRSGQTPLDIALLYGQNDIAALIRNGLESFVIACSFIEKTFAEKLTGLVIHCEERFSLLHQ